jgi:hypothetical protein
MHVSFGEQLLRSGIMERFLMTTCGKLLTHGTYIWLRKIGLPWRERKHAATNYIRKCHKKIMDKVPILYYLQGGLRDQQPCRMLEQLDQAS